MALIGPGVSEEKIFEIVDDGLTDDGAWVCYKLTCETSAQVSEIYYHYFHDHGLFQLPLQHPYSKFTLALQNYLFMGFQKFADTVRAN